MQLQRPDKGSASSACPVSFMAPTLWMRLQSQTPLSWFLRALARLLWQCTRLTFRADRGLAALHEHSGTATLVQHPVVDVVNPALVQPLTLDRVVRFHMGTSAGDH